jgi:hypothetical protein
MERGEGGRRLSGEVEMEDGSRPAVVESSTERGYDERRIRIRKWGLRNVVSRDP